MIYTNLSIILALILDVIDAAAAPPNLNIDSITDNSVEVVSVPTNAAQSLATKPPPTTLLPRQTVPAWNKNYEIQFAKYCNNNLHQTACLRKNLVSFDLDPC